MWNKISFINNGMEAGLDNLNIKILESMEKW